MRDVCLSRLSQTGSCAAVTPGNTPQSRLLSADPAKGIPAGMRKAHASLHLCPRSPAIATVTPGNSPEANPSRRF